MASCAAPTDPTPARKPEEVHPVGWQELTRDFQTAAAYQHRMVRVRLGKGDYAVRDDEVHVWVNTRQFPPVLVFHLRDHAGAPDGGVVLLAMCAGPQRDGKFRSTRGTDFCVHCWDAVIVPTGTSVD